jgi:hypothetical protein
MERETAPLKRRRACTVPLPSSSNFLKKSTENKKRVQVAMQPKKLNGRAKDTFKMAQDGLHNGSRTHSKRIHQARVGKRGNTCLMDALSSSIASTT